MQVDVYGSTDLFLHEYRVLLSDKLLALTSYQIDREVQPTPYNTLHPTSYTLHPTPYTLPPTPYTLHPTPYNLHPTPYTPQR